MEGPEIIARSITSLQIPDQYGNVWQYHPRSDRHSKISCWAIAFDLLQSCRLLREHVADGRVVLGVHHEMCDFETRRRKFLDLVVAQPPRGIDSKPKSTFADMANAFGVRLSDAQRAALGELPVARVAEVGSVLLAMEAKACMTAHVRALPRLHDELDSSHQTTHGNSERALAVGFVMVNAGPKFVSPDRNKKDLEDEEAVVNVHRQPADALRVIEKVGEIRRRSGRSTVGFDAVGVMVVDMANDGSPLRVLDEPASPFPYEEMVARTAHEYAAAFARI